MDYGDWEMGTAISRPECSQVAGLTQTSVMSLGLDCSYHHTCNTSRATVQVEPQYKQSHSASNARCGGRLGTRPCTIDIGGLGQDSDIVTCSVSSTTRVSAGSTLTQERQSHSLMNMV